MYTEEVSRSDNQGLVGIVTFNEKLLVTTKMVPTTENKNKVVIHKKVVINKKGR